MLAETCSITAVVRQRHSGKGQEETQSSCNQVLSEGEDMRQLADQVRAVVGGTSFEAFGADCHFSQAGHSSGPVRWQAEDLARICCEGRDRWPRPCVATIPAAVTRAPALPE